MKDYLVSVEENIKIADGLYKLTFSPTEGEFEQLKCGQFLHLEVPGLLLRRPFCLYKFSPSRVSIVYAEVGKGTEKMTELQKSDRIKVTMPLGNGWTLKDEHKKIVLIGGGVGCAPLCAVPKCYPDKKYHAFLGFGKKSKVAFINDFTLNCESVLCATDDGSYSVKGYPIPVFEKEIKKINPDVILVCGPKPMLKAVARFSAENKIPAYASTEERMGCGVGACLVCACAVKGKDGSVSMKRACADGPVFKLEELVL